MKKYLVDSRDRILANSSSSSSFRVTLNPPVTHACRATLKWVKIPNTIFNIRSAINNTLTFTVGGDTYTITIPPGAYTEDTLATQLETLMGNASSETFTVSYNESTFAMTISASVAFSIDFSQPTSCGAILGFPPAITSTGTAITGGVVHFNTDYLLLDIREFGPTLYNSTGNPYSFIIPIGQNPGMIEEYYGKKTFQQTVNVGPGPISDLHVSLYLRNHELVNLNGDWMFLIEFQ